MTVSYCFEIAIGSSQLQSQVQAIYLGKLQLATLHQMYIRPILEYCSVVWVPYTKHNIDELVTVQRHAARFVTINYSYSYQQCYCHDGNSKLEHPTCQKKYPQTDYILHNMVDISLPESILLLQPLLITQEVTIYLSAESMHTSTRSFFPATTNLWNEMNYLITCTYSRSQKKRNVV